MASDEPARDRYVFLVARACPDCGSGCVVTYKTCPRESDGSVTRYVACRDCGAKFKTVTEPPDHGGG